MQEHVRVKIAELIKLKLASKVVQGNFSHIAYTTLVNSKCFTVKYVYICRIRKSKEFNNNTKESKNKGENRESR